jgi:hypothetical protein
MPFAAVWVASPARRLCPANSFALWPLDTPASPRLQSNWQARPSPILFHAAARNRGSAAPAHARILQPFLEGSHRTNGVVRAERNRHRRGDVLKKEEDRDTSVAGFVTEKAAGVLHGPDRTRILRHQGIDGQQRNTLNRRLRH